VAFARAYGAGYLDKGEVTDRVMAVVKNFNKVETGKVSRAPGEGDANCKKPKK
jgi:hypothetical protein